MVTKKTIWSVFFATLLWRHAFKCFTPKLYIETHFNITIISFLSLPSSNLGSSSQLNYIKMIITSILSEILFNNSIQFSSLWPVRWNLQSITSENFWEYSFNFTWIWGLWRIFLNKTPFFGFRNIIYFRTYQNALISVIGNAI